MSIDFHVPKTQNKINKTNQNFQTNIHYSKKKQLLVETYANKNANSLEFLIKNYWFGSYFGLYEQKRLAKTREN